jgi:hypothetical protein
MINVEADRLVVDYLRRLETAAAHLQPTRRAELVTEIREHIEAALRQEDAASDAAVLNVLERLGSPEEIVDAVEPQPSEVRRAGGFEIAALVTLVVPFIGWLVGPVLVLISRAWSQREKFVGILLVFLPILILGLGLALGSPDGGVDPATPVDDSADGLQEDGQSQGAMVGPVELAFIFGTGLPSALYLGWKLRRDARTDPPQN